MLRGSVFPLQRPEAGIGTHCLTLPPLAVKPVLPPEAGLECSGTVSDIWVTPLC